MARVIILLLPLSITYGAADTEDSKYIIQYPCNNLVCFHLWKPAGVEIAVIVNEHFQTSTSEVEKSKCTLPINPVIDEDVMKSLHHCRRNPFNNPNILPINMLPGRKVSLQCALLRSLDNTSCLTHIYEFLAVQWVDENADPVQENSEYHITKRTPCDVTLTVAFQNPKSATFRCMAAMNDQEWTSEVLQVRLPAPKGKGRGVVIDIDKHQPGGDNSGFLTDQSNQVVGPTVGVLGAVVVMAAAVYVVNKRRSTAQLSNESHTSTANYVLDSDDVIYADVILPAASDQVCVSEFEPTEYACVRCTRPSL